MLHKNIKLLTWFNFFTDFQLYSPIAILYFAKVSGSFALGMSVFSLATVASAFFELPTGIFSDMIGRRRTVIYGALAAVFSAVCYAIGHWYWMLVIGSVFSGLSSSLYSGNNDALLHDTLAETQEEHQYGEFLGRISAMFQAALGVSAILGGILATWSFPLIMWLSVIPQVVCFVLSLYLVEPKIQITESSNIYEHLGIAWKKFISNKKLRLLSISSIVGYGFGEAGFQFQAAFYNTLWPVWAIGIAKTISYTIAALSYHFSGRVIKRFGGLKLLLIDNIYSRTINTFSTAFPTVLSPLLMSTTSVFFGITSVAKNTLFQQEFTNEQRATMGSLNSFAGSLFFALVAFLLGLVADKLTPARALLLMQVFQFANLFVYWTLFKNHREDY